MAKDKKDTVVAEDSATDESSINESAMQQGSSDDEASLSEALKANPAKMMVVRNTIKLKNHISIIPFLMVIVSMIILTFTIHIQVNAIVKLRNESLNAFLFFLNVLLSLISVLCYMRVSSRKSDKKMKIIMSILFYLVVAGEVYLDYFMIHDIQVETTLFNALGKVTDDVDNHWLARTYSATIAHLVCLGLSVLFSIAAPLLQPLAKKIHIRIK